MCRVVLKVSLDLKKQLHNTFTRLLFAKLQISQAVFLTFSIEYNYSVSSTDHHTYNIQF